MRIPADVVIEALKSYGPLPKLASEEARYSRLQLFPGGESTQAHDTLYVGRGRDMGGSARAACGFVCIGQPAADREQVIILPDTCDPYEVFGRLQELFTVTSDYEIELLKAAAAGSYQDMVDICFRAVANPLALLDSAFRVHAITDVEIPGDGLWDYLRTTGSPSPEVLTRLKGQGRLFLETRETFFIFAPPELKHPTFVWRAYVDGRLTGRIIAIEAFKPFSPLDKLLLKTLTEAVEMKMSGDQAFESVRGKGPLFGMLHTILHGLRLDPGLITETLQHQPGWMKGFFRVLSVPLDASSHAFDFYARLMEKKLDSLCLLFRNDMVAVLHYRDKEDFSSLGESVSEFLAGHSLRGGMSNEFDALSELGRFYAQAVAALELCEGDRGLHMYGDYTLKHILSFISDESRPLLGHPSLPRLKRYDEENGTQLFGTLHAFLRNERSLVKTAEALHIHRNTLVYRIGKIADILEIDLDDADTRLHLLISYRL